MFGRKRKPEDFSEELRAHLALEADQLRAEGRRRTPGTARRPPRHGQPDQPRRAFLREQPLDVARPVPPGSALRLAPVAPEQRLHRRGRADPRARNRRQHRHLHAGQRHCAALAPGGQSRAHLPPGHGRRLLRQQRLPEEFRALLLSALPRIARPDAGIRRPGRHAGGAGSAECAARGRPDAAGVHRPVRFRKLLPHVGRERLCGTRAGAGGRCGRRAARRHVELSRLGPRLRARSFRSRRALCNRWPAVHHRRYRPARLLWRYPARRSARCLAAPGHRSRSPRPQLPAGARRSALAVPGGPAPARSDSRRRRGPRERRAEALVRSQLRRTLQPPAH